MLWVLANDHNAALALNDFAFIADFLDRRSYLHCACLLPSPCGSYVQVDLFHSSTKRAVRLVCSGLFEAICDTSASQIVRGELDGYLVARKNTNEIHAYLSGNMSKDDMSVLKFDLEHRIGKLLYDSSLYLDDILF